MKKQFEILREACQLLNWEEQASSLDALCRSYEAKQYFVVFTGQFSAGKSCLINNLLGKEILPTGVRETTAILTYIQYSSNEYALAHFTDGSVSRITLDEVHTITQNGAVWDPEKLDYLEIFVCSEILRTGMVLLDTPGINTIIERHGQLLASTLDLASRVIYVVGRAPHKTDLEMMRTMTGCGMTLAYVRTHFDEVNPREESFDDAIRQDVQLISGCSIPAENCYHVSNLQDSKWYGNIRSVRSLLERDGRCTEEALNAATAKRLHQLGQDAIAALEEKKSLLEEARAGNWEVCSQKLTDCNVEIARFEYAVDQHQRKLKKDLRDAESDVYEKVRWHANTALDKAAAEIVSSTAASPAQMAALMDEQTRRLLGTVVNSIDQILSPYLSGIYSALKQENLAIEQYEIPDIGSYSELVQIQNTECIRLSSQLERLRSQRSELDRQLLALQEDPAYLQIQNDLIELEREIQAYSESYDSIPPYTPQMILVEDGRLQPSQVAKTIGSIADWALMLIPGTQITGAINAVSKSSTVVGKIAKFIGKSEKVMKAIENADKFRDVLYAVNNMSKTYATKARKEKAVQIIADTGDRAGKMLEAYKKVKESVPATFLDYLTVEHWAEQIGKQFDVPPQLTVDREYERQYHDAKTAIEHEILTRQRRTYEIKLKQQLFMSSQEQLTAERNAAIVDEQTVMAELERKKTAIAEAAQKASLQKWKKSCGDSYRSQMAPQIEEIIRQQLRSFTERLRQYHEDATEPIRAQLSASREMYEQLLRERDNIPEELSRTTELVAQLKAEAL